MSDPSCRPILDDLPLYLTGDLDAGATARVAAHLERCAVCRTVRDQERRVLEVLQRSSTEDATGALDDFYEARLRPSLHGRARWRWAVQAAALLLAFLVGMAVHAQLRGDVEESATSTARGGEHLYRLYSAQGNRSNDLARALAALRAVSRAPGD